MMDSSNEWSKTEIFHHVMSEVLTLRLRAHKISTFERRRKKKDLKALLLMKTFELKKKISEQESGIRIHVGWIQVFSCCVHSQSQRTAREAKTSKFHLMKDVMGRLVKKNSYLNFSWGRWVGKLQRHKCRIDLPLWPSSCLKCSWRHKLSLKKIDTGWIPFTIQGCTIFFMTCLDFLFITWWKMWNLLCSSFGHGSQEPQS